MQNTLNDLGLKFGTDKASDINNFLDIYEFFLKDFQSDSFNLLELGVGPEHNKGKSLLMWKHYFKQANIIGVDIREDAKTVEEDRIKVEIGNLGKRQFLNELGEQYLPKVIIDDASHSFSHQINGFLTLWKYLKPGGIYICEDLITSFRPLSNKINKKGHYIYNDNEGKDAFSFFESLAIYAVGKGRKHNKKVELNQTKLSIAKQIDFISFMRHSVIIKKKV